MELKPLPPELDELRSIIISTSLTSCFLLFEELTAAGGRKIYYDKFRARWIQVFKDVYGQISKMQPRGPRE